VFSDHSAANHVILCMLFGRIVRGVTNLDLSPPDLHGFLVTRLGTGVLI
jgi:hypothetical protein